MKSAWKDILFKVFLKQVKHLDIIDIFLSMKERLSRKDLDLFALHTWAVWKERMRILHNSDRFRKGADLEWSRSVLRDYHNARAALNTDSASMRSRPLPRWNKPPLNHVRLEVDAAF